MIKRLKPLAKVFLQCGAVADVLAVLVLQGGQLLQKLFFELAFGRSHCGPWISCWLAFAACQGRSALGALSLDNFRTDSLPLVTGP